MNRLVVSTETISRDCGEYAAKVIETLNHTPARAVGNNFFFVCRATDWVGGPKPRLGTVAAEDLGAIETRWAGQFLQDGALVEAELTFTPGEVVVFRLNFDRRMDDDSNEAARAAARAFRDDYQQAVTLVRRLLSVDVT